MSIIDKLKKWFEPTIVPDPPKAPPPIPQCEHQWHEYKKPNGESLCRECRKCWQYQKWEKDHWHDVSFW